MTDLQTSLIGIGGVIVVGVIAYNKWHEYRVRKNVERAFSGGPDDVLMSPGLAKDAQAARQEPTFSEPASSPEVGLQERDEPTLETDAEPEVKKTPTLRNVPIDPLIDCVIPLEMDEPVRGEKILPLVQSLRHVGNKPVCFVGLVAEGDGNEQWQVIAHGGVYRKLQAGVQLANRGGSLNELEYSEFVMRLRQIADGIGAELDVPDMPQVMVSAKSLFQFVADHDAKLSINVRSKGASWPMATIVASLERLGFDLRPDGNFVMHDGADGGILYSLSTNVTPASDVTNLLTLLLDVPCVSPQSGGFKAMTACAKSLCQRLDGRLVDDGGQPLDDSILSEIANQVGEFCTEMEAADIPAGSIRALRLFVR